MNNNSIELDTGQEVDALQPEPDLDGIRFLLRLCFAFKPIEEVFPEPYLGWSASARECVEKFIINSITFVEKNKNVVSFDEQWIENIMNATALTRRLQMQEYLTDALESYFRYLSYLNAGAELEAQMGIPLPTGIINSQEIVNRRIKFCTDRGLPSPFDLLHHALGLKPYSLS